MNLKKTAIVLVTVSTLALASSTAFAAGSKNPPPTASQEETLIEIIIRSLNLG